MLSNKLSVIKHVTKEFARIYKTKDDNEHYEAELQDKLSKLQKTRQKHMDMYTDDMISREEMREKMSAVNTDIEKIENELKLITYNLSKGNQLEDLLSRTFQTVDDIIAMEEITNAQLKQVIQKITVTHDGNCDIYLRLFGDIGLDETYTIADNQT